MLKKIISIFVVLVIIILVSVVFINFYNKSKLEKDNFSNSERIIDNTNTEDNSNKSKESKSSKNKDTKDKKNSDEVTEELVDSNKTVSDEDVSSDSNNTFESDDITEEAKQINVDNTSSYVNPYIAFCGNIFVIFGVASIIISKRS